MLKDLYQKKSAIKSPKKTREPEEGNGDEENKKKAIFLAQFENNMQ